MKIVPFGNTSLRVSEFGLGCARIGGIFQGNARRFDDLLAGARDAGITFFDTADMYSQGESEALLGRAFRHVRQQVIIASKAGYCLPRRRRWVARIKPLVRPVIRLLGLRRDQLPASARGELAQDFSPGYLRSAVDGSLQRLRTDYIDILQLHSPPLEVIQRGEWREALESLKRAGKIRYYGVACANPEGGLAALEHTGVSSVQFTLSLLEQGAQESLLPALAARGVGGIARECLANGLLAKPSSEIDFAKYTSSPEERARKEKQLVEIRAQAQAEGVSPIRLALRHVREQPGVSVTLLGASSLPQLRAVLAQIPA